MISNDFSIISGQLKFSPKAKYKDFRPVIFFEVAIIQIRPLKKTALYLGSCGGPRGGGLFLMSEVPL